MRMPQASIPARGFLLAALLAGLFGCVKTTSTEDAGTTPVRDGRTTGDERTDKTSAKDGKATGRDDKASPRDGKTTAEEEKAKGPPTIVVEPEALGKEFLA